MNGEPDLYIGGQWRHASDGGTREIVNPADGSVAAVVDEATPDDARDAVAAARAAFDDGAWPATPVAERAALLDRIADLLQRDKESLARLETEDTGKTLVESRIDIDDVTSVFRYYAKLVARRVRPAGRRRRPRRDQPRGARAHRCVRADRAVELPAAADVLEDRARARRRLHDGRQAQRGHARCRPSRSSTCSRRPGCPPAVVNLVQGSGAVLGDGADRHPDVDFISFTGGLGDRHDHLEGGRRARHQGRRRTRRQEPAHRVRRRASWDSAVDQVLTGVFLHSGQVCSAGTRLIVEESIADDFVAALVDARREDPDGRRHGPGQRDRSAGVRAAPRQGGSACRSGISEGAKLVTGGARPSDPALAKGSFYLPTIFDRCDRSMRIVQEETFGPILTVERFTDEAEAIALGNDTEYGLAAGVRTSDPARGERVVRALAARHGVAQRLRLLHRGGGVGRIRKVRQRSRARSDRARGIPRDQTHLAQHRAETRRLVQGMPADRPPRQHFRRTIMVVEAVRARRQRHGGLRLQGVPGPQHRQVRQLRRRASATSRSSPARSSCSTSASAPAGPAYLWSWPMVFVGQMAVALCFMELAAKYPGGRLGLQLVARSWAAGSSAGRRAG